MGRADTFAGSLFVLANGIFATAPSTECKTKALTFMNNEPLGFQVSRNNALKRITAQLPALRKALLSDRLLESAALAAVKMPIVLDVGAAAFGPPEYYTGSDSLLVLKVSDVAVSVHAFEMQHSVADQLQKEAMLALKIAAPGSTHEVHRIGVGAKQSELLASPMEGTDKVQTLTLTGGSGQSKRNHVFRTRVTSLDWWESEHSFNRSILYIKVDTNGHEPAVLQGLTRLMSVRPPLFLSFEYSFGWSTLFSNITIKLMRKKARQVSAKDGTLMERNLVFKQDPATVVGGAMLRDFVANLSAAHYAVYLTHERGLVRVDGTWWQSSYELELNERVKSPAPQESWDLIAAYRGSPQRALERLFLFAPLPCLTVPGMPNNCKEQPPLAEALMPECASALMAGVS